MCHCPHAHGCCLCSHCPVGSPALPRCVCSQTDLMLLEETANRPFSPPRVSFGGGKGFFSSPRYLQPPQDRPPQRMALETSYCWQDLEHQQLQVMLPSTRGGEDLAGADGSSSWVPTPSTRGRACESLWAGPACVQRETVEGFNAAGRGKGCREVGPRQRLSWSIPGVRAGLGLAAGVGTGPAAIQLTTLLSRQVKSQLSEAMDRMSSRGQIQAAKPKGFLASSFLSNCADTPLLDQGQVLGVQVG